MDLLNELNRKAETPEALLGGNEIHYNLALTYFELADYQSSVELLDRILGKAYESYPQLTLPCSDQTTVAILRKTTLIEALNLKAAI